MSDDPRPVYEPAWHARTVAIAQDRGDVDTVINVRRHPCWQQNAKMTKVVKASGRPASFASARPVPPRTVRPAPPADGVTACMRGAVLAPAPTPEVGKAPVFVDDSGARKRLLRVAGVLIALLSVGFLTVVGVALAVSPVNTSVGLGSGAVPFIVPSAAPPPPPTVAPARATRHPGTHHPGSGHPSPSGRQIDGPTPGSSGSLRVPRSGARDTSSALSVRIQADVERTSACAHQPPQPAPTE
jgi:hypothetical protein